ncbi:hypothetical protein C0J52_11169 [Blattella germanica]|nr:hypothetical protein C0J52_11169 [Blattella germanica]
MEYRLAYPEIAWPLNSPGCFHCCHLFRWILHTWLADFGARTTDIKLETDGE